MSRTVVVLIMISLAAAPVASAAWSAWGGLEPDTPQDVADRRIFLDPDPSPRNLSVYFNGVVNDGSTLGVVRQNPNVGALGTRIVPFPMMTASAILGLWRDCNNDGYVGAAESAVWDYRSELLTEQNVAGVEVDLNSGACPEGSLFNRNGWVSELIWIANSSAANTARTNTDQNPDGFPRIFNDTGAQAWADIGRPGVASDVHYDCPQEPMPRGTLDSTGGFMYWLDCQLGYNVARLINEAGVPGIGISRYEPQRDCDSALNRPTTPTGLYGQDECEGEEGRESQQTGLLESERHTSDPTQHEGYDKSNPMVTAFDCSEDKFLAPQDETKSTRMTIQHPTNSSRPLAWVNLTDSEYYFARVAKPAPSVNAQGSLVDGLDNIDNGWSRGGKNCDPNRYAFGNTTDRRGPGSGDDLPEDDFSATNPVDGKRVVDMPLVYAGGYGNQTIGGQTTPCSGAEGDLLAAVDQNASTTTRCVTLVPRSTHPGQFGLRPASTGRYTGGIIYLPPTYLGTTVRNDDLTPHGGFWMTFYARLGATSLAANFNLPPGATDAVYGQEFCNGATSGKHNNWDCDPANWYNTAKGGTARPPNGAAVPGEVYQLRDIDCYDGTIVGPVRASLADFSGADEGPCPDPFA